MKPTLGIDEHAELAGTPDDPRRAYFEDQTEATGITEIFFGLHHIDVDEPEEEFGRLRQSFTSWVGTLRQNLPEYARWLESNGSEQAYAHHRRALQLFNYQRLKQQGRQEQWLLKMPFHLMEWGALVKAYPDALLIQTHTEHAQFMTSWNNLVKGTYILEYIDSSTPCSRVVEVPAGNASRRAVAPVPRATVRVYRTRMLSAAL